MPKIFQYAKKSILTRPLDKEARVCSASGTAWGIYTAFDVPK